MDFIAKKDGDYALIDSGEGEKLERYGEYILRRPDPEALWKKTNEEIWNKADAKFVRVGNKTSWKADKLPKEWPINYGGFKFLIRPTTFKHTGLFPEQITNWQFIENEIRNAGRKISVLNLFAYTGGATLASLDAGANVTHVDASKIAVTWAKENTKLSGLEDKPVRWMVDDCMAFLRREVKRGNKYDAIIMDPPSFGHGPKDELWKIEEDFAKLLDLCKKVLSDNPLFVVVSGYASGYSAKTYERCLKDVLGKFGGEYESGEIAIEGEDGNILPAGITVRWRNK